MWGGSSVSAAFDTFAAWLYGLMLSAFESSGMANLLRQVVASPRQRNAEAGLDLCYVTDNIMVTSGPSSTYPARAYRNPTDQLVRWLDLKHGDQWMIWEFRAEGTGYPDSEVYGRVKHYPFPDHHPPPFQMIPAIMASMRNWLHEEKGASDSKSKSPQRTVVVHCKAGKGRSGTMTTSYLISEEGWAMQDALNRFTERRMRPGFGPGVSIPSQVRWVGYVDRWTRSGKTYVERRAVVKEIHVWGLRDGVKVSVEGFVDSGRRIKSIHTFSKEERLVVDGSKQNGSLAAEMAGAVKVEQPPQPSDVLEKRTTDNLIDTSDAKLQAPNTGSGASSGNVSGNDNERDNSVSKISTATTTISTIDTPGAESGGRAILFRPTKPVMLETSDICIDFERRNRAKYGWTMVTSVAHVWFNVFFEGLVQAEKDKTTPTPEKPPTSGVFNIEWDAMDGIKGTSRKGIRAFDRLAVVWGVEKDPDGSKGHVVLEPEPGEPVPESKASDWRGGDAKHDAGENETGESGDVEDVSIKYIADRDLGLRKEGNDSANISKANSVRSVGKSGKDDSVQHDTASGGGGSSSSSQAMHAGFNTHAGPNATEITDTAGKEAKDADDQGIKQNSGGKMAATVEKAYAGAKFLGDKL